MSMKRSGAWLLAICAAAGFGCADNGATQVLTGHVATRGAIAVRAVTGDSVVTAAQVRSDGTFTIAVPKGRNYRLEVMTSSGVRHVLANKGGGLQKLTFDVCQPVDPYDVGGIGGGGTTTDPGPIVGGPTPCDPLTDPYCLPPLDCEANNTCPPECSPGSNGTCEPPPMCDLTTDPTCGTGCQPGDDCVPPPPICTDPSDPYCMCDSNGQCPPTECNGSNGEVCPPPPPPPCADPTNPESCNDDNCMSDPTACGCSSDEPNCWPNPEPPSCDANGLCEPGGMAPEHPPGDFGCGDDGNGGTSPVEPVSQ